jgi:hypothetical protein
LHGDPGQVRRVGPDDARAVIEPNVADRSLADETVYSGQQGVVEATTHGEFAVMDLAECTQPRSFTILECREDIDGCRLIRGGFGVRAW